MQWSMTRKDVREALRSLLVLLVFGLLFQEIRTGHRIVDIVVFRVGFRVLALGLIVWFAARALRRDRPSTIARGLGAGLLMFAFLSGVRFSLVLTSDDKMFQGVYLLSWFGLLLLLLWHSMLVTAGVLLLLFARHRGKSEEHSARNSEHETAGQ